MKRLAIAVLAALALELVWILGYHAGYADASTSRSAQVIPAASASRSESDPGRTGAPNETAPPSSAAEQDSLPPLAVSVRETLEATWYCNADPSRGPLSRCTRGHPDGPGLDLFAAISPDLAYLRGQMVRVCLAARCVIVLAIDCMCSGRAAVDLYADAFEVLAPLGLGRVTVAGLP